MRVESGKFKTQVKHWNSDEWMDIEIESKAKIQIKSNQIKYLLVTLHLFLGVMFSLLSRDSFTGLEFLIFFWKAEGLRVECNVQRARGLWGRGELRMGVGSENWDISNGGVISFWMLSFDTILCDVLGLKM